ncbi:undecaprenyl-diphosphate phosphatase [Solitalea lacus]|uniref:undecaprenyl-diphosphate phosphatase n=1 Tax=Solitalea lacus TaxID=2911172 RepID=UPI001EDBF120|nr:undecaprenyl-diphosphate phosphatase [Solitalea lacus]UKJ07034.1 undecaprenyl-diphosphate phosphatase [Solitalea lacus]
MTLIQAIVLAIVEGLTEFLPVSSTGHMIITSWLMKVPNNDFTKFFTVGIQFGTILSVVILYFNRFFQSFEFYLKLFIAFIPAAIFGVLFSDQIDALLESVLTVGIMLLVGGIVFLLLDEWFKATENNPDKEIKYNNALIIGLFQCIAMIPGVSRSASTIIGGLTQKLNRKQAAEFSFFLAVPTMFAATAKKTYDFYKSGISLSNDEWQLFGIGNLVGFIVAIIAIRAFIGYLTKHGFKIFGWYRIIVGIIILVFYFMGHDLQII